MVKIMEKPTKMDDLRGPPLFFGNTHINGVCLFQNQHASTSSTSLIASFRMAKDCWHRDRTALSACSCAMVPTHGQRIQISGLR